MPMDLTVAGIAAQILGVLLVTPQIGRARLRHWERSIEVWARRSSNDIGSTVFARALTAWDSEDQSVTWSHSARLTYLEFKLIVFFWIEDRLTPRERLWRLSLAAGLCLVLGGLSAQLLGQFVGA